MSIRVCIFDLDGTLTDTQDSLTFSVNLTMKGWDCQRLQESSADVCGKRKQSSSGKKHCVPRSEEALRGWRKRWKYMGESSMRIVMYHVAPYEGIVQLLGTFKRAGNQMRCSFQ